ncbi:sodium:calcium antiporter [Luteolibacter sp. LG18]|uniref:sodium:calcium antiporter n=1 Tax=Luteolibacter sp. LG18 TaxID=2819286 RepID=UPI002B2D1B96|nr:sodium:calcium antiporter [Luteolibacter sp. LG18]
MTIWILLLLAGVALAWIGGTLFVNGGIGIAKWAKWPAAVIGVTVAAFGTSSPELMVAVRSAIGGVPEISLGDVLGSNVVNISLILALVLAFSGMQVQDKGVGRDWLIALATPILLTIILCDGWFSRFDAALLLICFTGWLVCVVRHARRHAAAHSTEAAEVAEVPQKPRKLIIAELCGGLLLLVGSAQLVVLGGTGVATALGWSPFLVGAVVIALATGTPELATTIVSRVRGHHDVGLGTILGSNVFNSMVVAAAAALIKPYPVAFREIWPSLAIGGFTTLVICPGKSGRLNRKRGVALLLTYAGYLAWNILGKH